VGAAAGAEGDIDRRDCREQLRPRLVGLAALLVESLIGLGTATDEQGSSALEPSGHVSGGE
jgi:hypothetical protein